MQPGSPLIDAGTDVGIPFCGAAPDVGAIEVCPQGLEPVQGFHERRIPKFALDYLEDRDGLPAGIKAYLLDT